MIDKASIKKIHDDLNVALKAFADAHNLNVSPFGIRYTETGFSFKCDMADKTATGDANPKLFKTLQRYGTLYDLKVEDIGKEFIAGGIKVKFAGLHGRRGAYAIYTVQNKMYKKDARDFAKENNRNPVAALADFGV